MTLNDYQKAAERTSGNLTSWDKIRNGCYGLNGEAGECIDILKKVEFQGHTFDPNKLLDELGDVLWYVAQTATGLGVTLEYVAQHNVDKLMKRYPDGFDSERSVHRPEYEGGAKMADCFSKSELTDFCNLMKLPNGTPLLPIDMLDWLVNKGFFKAPASTKYHGAHEGGLYQHSASVMKFLVQLTKDNDLHWQDERSPYIVGMFHDLCKIDQYRNTSYGLTLDGQPLHNPCEWEYNPHTLLKGHGEKSVMLLSQFYRLTEEEIACIRYHMGAFTPKEEWNDYTGAIHTYPNVLWTHQADMLASHVAGI